MEYKYYNSAKYDAILTQIDDNIYKQKVGYLTYNDHICDD